MDPIFAQIPKQSTFYRQAYSTNNDPQTPRTFTQLMSLRTDLWTKKMINDK